MLSAVLRVIESIFPVFPETHSGSGHSSVTDLLFKHLDYYEAISSSFPSHLFYPTNVYPMIVSESLIKFLLRMMGFHCSPVCSPQIQRVNKLVYSFGSSYILSD